MKYLASLLLLLLLTVQVRAADSYFGLKGETNSLHATTNYLLVVMGDGTNAVIRKVSPTQLKNILAGLGVITNNQSTTFTGNSVTTTTDASIGGELDVVGLLQAGGPATFAKTIGHTTSSVSGVGGANTNFTLMATTPKTYINGFTNVSLRAVMGYAAGTAYNWSLTITNFSGSNRTLEFSQVTNAWRFAGVYGTNAPNTLTNMTKLLIAGESDGTNTFVGYQYFAGP